METAQIIIVEGRRGREGEKNSSNISVIWLVQIMFFLWSSFACIWAYVIILTLLIALVETSLCSELFPFYWILFF